VRGGLLAALAVAPQADAATIYACVKKNSGATRIVGRTTRCRHGEQRLSWSVTGPAGKPGANGVNGANGAVAGFTATDASLLPLEEKSTVLVSKVVPPGSYIVSAKTALEAHSVIAAAAFAEWALLDTPGTSPALLGEPRDAAIWGTALTAVSEFNADATLPFAAGITSTVTSTIDIVCGVGATPVKAVFPQITAIQTSQNS